MYIYIGKKNKNMTRISINKKENDINILKVLKFLYRDGTGINSIEDVSNLFNLYEENGKIEIEITDNALNEIKEDLSYLNVIFHEI